jgi:hypothetical protein
MARTVSVHHVDEESFLKGNVEVDLEEVGMPRFWKK